MPDHAVALQAGAAAPDAGLAGVWEYDPETSDVVFATESRTDRIAEVRKAPR